MIRQVSDEPNHPTSRHVKILHTVESYLPARHGMSEVVRQISERLAARGHEITVATGVHPERPAVARIDGVEVRSFDVSGKSALAIRGDSRGYQKFLADSGFDVIVNFAAQQWATDLALPLLPQLSARKVFVPTGFSALGDSLFRSYFEKMKGWMKDYDACVFLSDDYRDIQFARAAGVDKIAIIPNGAAEEEFRRPADPAFRRRLGIPEDHLLIVHIAGYLSVAKGQKEAIQIFSESHLQNATLLMVSGGFSKSPSSALRPRELASGVYNLLRGRGMRGFGIAWQLQGACRAYSALNQKNHRRIVCTALSREDTISAFLDADLFLFPSWIECSPLVLFEAAAARTPFLVTPVGNSAEIIRWTGGGELLEGTPIGDREGSIRAKVQEGVRLLDALGSDPARRRAMAEAGHAAWEKYFTWSAIAGQYEELYRALVAGEDIRNRFFAIPASVTHS